MVKVLIIVAGSWGIIFILEFIYDRIFPTYDHIILRTVEAEKDLPDRAIKSKLDNSQHDLSFY